MFNCLPWLAYGQSSIASASVSNSISRGAVASSSASVSAAATGTYVGKPYLAFQPIPTQTACGLTHIFFNVYGEDASKVNVTLYALNAGIDQTIPSAASSRASSARATSSSAAIANSQAVVPRSSSSSIVQLSVTPTAAATTSARPTSAAAVAAVTTSRNAVVARHLLARTELNINITLTKQYANHGWDFNPLKLPEGRYYILGVVDDDYTTTNRSNVFSVIEGEDTSCLSAFAQASLSATGTSTKPAITSTDGSASSEAGSEKKGLSGGGIAGVVLGVLIGLGLIALLMICCVRRRRNQRTGNTGGFGFGSRHRKMPSGSVLPSDSGHGHGQGSGSTGEHDVGNTKGQIAMSPMRKEGSYRSDMEKRESVDSMGNTVENNVPVSYATGAPAPGPDASKPAQNGLLGDPFGTPTLAEIRAVSPMRSVSPMFTTDEIEAFNTAPERSSMASIAAPPVALLRSNSQVSTGPAGLDFSATRSSLVGLGIGPSPVVSSRSTADTHAQTHATHEPLIPPSALSPGSARRPSAETGVGPFASPNTPGNGFLSGPSSARITPPSSGASTPPQTSPNPGSFPSQTQYQVGSAGLTRNGSTRRKPVPSLGPELRTELERQASQKGLREKSRAQAGKNGLADTPSPRPSGGSGGQEEGGKKSYQLMPDPPMIHE
ncbi:hypothetical protein IAU59_005212 [Kwoniella sp. CBS 9459]